MRTVLPFAMVGALLAPALQAQPNPFKLPKQSLTGEVTYALSGDLQGEGYTAFDGARTVRRSTGTVRMMGKDTKTTTWSLVTADSMYHADLEAKRGTAAPNLLPFMAKAYDGLDKEGKGRFHDNLREMAGMFSQVFSVGGFGSSGEKKGEKTIAGEVCEERTIMGFTVCSMKRGPQVPLYTSGSLICYQFEETATSVSLTAPAGSAFDRPEGITFQADPMMEKPDSVAQGFVGYLASQALTDSLAAARAELEKAKADAAAQGKSTEMTAAEKDQMQAACEMLKGFDMNQVMASAGKAAVSAAKQAAANEAKKAAANKVKGLFKKPKIP
jgi:hypothetical protein